jgi:hypothetical protein
LQRHTCLAERCQNVAFGKADERHGREAALATCDVGDDRACRLVGLPE